jgi:hypothetical protein
MIQVSRSSSKSAFLMKMMIADDRERLLLAHPSTGKISTTCKQRVLYSVGQLHYPNFAGHRNEFIA